MNVDDDVYLTLNNVKLAKEFIIVAVVVQVIRIITNLTHPNMAWKNQDYSLRKVAGVCLRSCFIECLLQ